MGPFVLIPLPPQEPKSKLNAMVLSLYPVGEAFTDPPKPAKCDGTPEDCSGEVRINASKETAEANDMSNVVSGGDMTDVDGSGGYSATNTYVSTVAATVAAVCVAALL